MPTIDLSGRPDVPPATIHYEDESVKPDAVPLILLHGRFGTAGVDFPKLIGWLSKTYHVYGPSMRGYGQSTPKPRDYPNDFYHRDARDMLAFMDELRIERALLVGFSDGGEVALVAAGLAPERFIATAVWGAVGYFGPEMRPWVEQNVPVYWMDEETKQLNGIEDPEPIVQQWVDACLHMIDSGGDVSLSLAPNITGPVLLMLGREDKLNPAEYGQRFADAVPDGKLILFDTGHSCHDQAEDAFNQTLEYFLWSATRETNTSSISVENV